MPKSAEKWAAGQAALLSRQVAWPTMKSVAASLSKIGPKLTKATANGVLEGISRAETRALFGPVFNLWREHYPDFEPSIFAIALRAAGETARRQGEAESVEVVWSGPRPVGAKLRRTDEVLYSLVEGAKFRILLVTFAAYDIPRLKEALLRASKRGVKIRFILESKTESEGAVTVNPLKALGQELGAVADVYHWPMKNRQKGNTGKPGVLHVKCAVVDGEHLLVSSANMTGHALSINMELGLCMHGGAKPQEVEKHFDTLVSDGVLVRLAS